MESRTTPRSEKENPSPRTTADFEPDGGEFFGEQGQMGGAGAEYAQRFGFVAQIGDIHEGFGREEVSKNIRIIILMDLRIRTLPERVGRRTGILTDGQAAAPEVLGHIVDGDGVPVVGFRAPGSASGSAPDRPGGRG